MPRRKPGLQRLIQILLAIAIITSILVGDMPAHAQSTPAVLQEYMLPGERAFTIEKPLHYDGKIYQLHYFTTGQLETTNPSFISIASSTYFDAHQITGLLVTADNEVIRDVDELCNQLIRIIKIFSGQFYNKMGSIVLNFLFQQAETPQVVPA